MSHFCLLADPDGYSVSDIDLISDTEARLYWLKQFENHFADTLSAAKVAYGRSAAGQIESSRRQFAETISSLRENPGPADSLRPDRLGVLELCRLREKALRDNGLKDPFRHIKQREDILSIESYPGVIDFVKSLPSKQRWEHLIRSVFAGNIFDLGSTATMNYAKDRVDFEAVVERTKHRPWVVDDFDELAAILPTSATSACPWAKAIVFVDNTGADFILGVIPLVRQFAIHGTQIVLAANELPSLNDVTADEAVEILRQLASVDDELASYISAGLFEVVSTGNDIPLIDLAEVSDELNAAAKDADLVVLEGMGRSVESNLNTEFSVDSIQLCLLKDPTMAARVGGEVFDCVCRYRRGVAS
ncbi:MAG: ARMT1-like domain-containing protein [Planctomycetota bacterium]|nr:ARMT1-like domain-containing protein [Planctomycetota bacterium]